VAGNIVGFINSSTDAAVIGRLYGPASLGAYALGFQTGRRAVANVTYVTNQVVFPAYSKLQGDPERFRRAYLRSLRFISVISMPAGFGLATLSDEFVRVVYGANWEAAIPVLAIIAFHGLFLSVSATTGEVFKAVGKPQFFFRTGLLHLVLLFGMIGALYPFGIAGFAGARAVASFAVGLVALAWASKIIGIETPIWLRTLRPSFTAAVMMAAVLFATKFGLGLVTETATPLLLIFFIAEGMALYILAMRIFASREWADFLTELGTLSGFPSIRRRVRHAVRGRRSVVPG
jgi:O-antigen/teichoic acid export membrane protein